MMTQRPLVAYFASPYYRSEVAIDDIKRLQEVVYPFEGQHIDILIETDGGDPDAAEGIVSMLQSILKGFRAIVPLRAKSSGTLICLAADQILMGPSSELGPIEPQINGVPASILIESNSRGNQLYAEHALQQTTVVAKRLLERGMMRDNSQQEREDTVKKLSTRDGFFSHGAVIDHIDAQDLHLNIEYLPVENELWKKLFMLHCFYSFDSSARRASKFFEQEMFSAIVLADEPD